MLSLRLFGIILLSSTIAQAYSPEDTVVKGNQSASYKPSTKPSSSSSSSSSSKSSSSSSSSSSKTGSSTSWVEQAFHSDSSSNSKTSSTSSGGTVPSKTAPSPQKNNLNSFSSKSKHEIIFDDKVKKGISTKSKSSESSSGVSGSKLSSSSSTDSAQPKKNNLNSFSSKTKHEIIFNDNDIAGSALKKFSQRAAEKSKASTDASGQKPPPFQHSRKPASTAK